MNISVRLFLGYFLVVGLAAWFALNTFTQEVEPGIRQATEETLVDAAHMLAELAAQDLAYGRINGGSFAASLRAARHRLPSATISGVKKESIDFRVYVTDNQGRVVYDSEHLAVGSDFSQWRDIARVLKGEYGARHTQEDPDDPGSAVMYVAAPIYWQGETIGVLSLAKPMATLTPYIQRAAARVKEQGVLMMAATLVIGLVFSAWLTWSIFGLIRYARAVSSGVRMEPPTGGGRQFSELARALAAMRERLEGKQYVEKYVQNLAHEMKSPLTAITSAAELLQEHPPEAERQRFSLLIQEQAERMQLIIERMLQLARVEQLQSPEGRQPLDLQELLRQALASRGPALEKRRLRSQIQADEACTCKGDAFLLQQAVLNLIDNAIDFSPEGGLIQLSLSREGQQIRLQVRDQGAGAPDYALPQLFDRFYSLPHPATGRKSTGLGLPLVREVARLHGGDARFENCPGGGAQVTLTLPTL